MTSNLNYMQKNLENKYENYLKKFNKLWAIIITIVLNNHQKINKSKISKIYIKLTKKVEYQ